MYSLGINFAEQVITCRKHVEADPSVCKSKTYSFVQASSLEIFTSVVR